MTQQHESRRIGLMMRKERGYSRSILGGVIQYARQHADWELVDGGPPSPKHLLNLLGEAAVDGIIAEIRDQELLELCRRHCRHLVMVASGPQDLPLRGWGCITTDNLAVGQIAHEYFWNRGFRSFGFVGEPGRVFSDQRMSMFQTLTKARNLDFHLSPCAPRKDPESFINWMRGLPPRTAILAANDPSGLEILRAARTIGRSVPEDLVVLGVDNDELACELTHPALSSIDINTTEIGMNAAQLMALLLAGSLPRQLRSVTIKPKCVVERRSTDSLAVEDPRLRKVLKIIQARACNGLTIPDLVEEAHMSRRALEVDFRELFGRTLQEQINIVRVARARELLKSTNLPTPEIAEECGWPSASQMSKLFKRHTGMTPTAFRIGK